MMRMLCWTGCTLIVMASISAAADVSDFVDFSLPRPGGGTPLLPGRLYVPPEASGGPRPLIMFLHGGGEAGVDNSAQVNGNIDNLLAEAKRRGAFLFAPQSTSDWGSMTLTDRAITMIDRALLEYQVDASRLYVTGLSFGGGGTWNMLSRYGDRFAAAIPIAGVGPASGFLSSRLVNEPIWAFHARNDGVVSFTASRNSINGILDAAAQPRPIYPAAGASSDYHFDAANLDLHYTEYSSGGHGIWGRVYSTPDVYDWMFARSSVVPEPSTPFIAALLVTALHRLRRRRDACHAH